MYSLSHLSRYVIIYFENYLSTERLLIDKSGLIKFPHDANITFAILLLVLLLLYLTPTLKVFTALVKLFRCNIAAAPHHRITAKGTQLNFGNKRRERGSLGECDYANISLVPKLPSRSRHEERSPNTQRATYR